MGSISPNLCKFFVVLLTFFTSATATLNSIPWLHPRVRRLPETPTTVSNDFQTYYYPQILDHFNYRPESYTTFQQRYVINFKYWGGANSSAPIFAYLGEEVSLDQDLKAIGFLTDHAAEFNALLVYMEHRYYGESVPFGSFKRAFGDANHRGYFSSAQALADYAKILIFVKKNLTAIYSPVIVIGGSYGGMLAAWFRLKYPHVALGALASSAPILYFEDITPMNGFFSVVTKDFRDTSETCYQTIKQSWSEIDKVAAEPNGLSILSKRFQTCKPLKQGSELKNYLFVLYRESAKYDSPPQYPVNLICNAMDKAPFGNDILSKVFAGIVGIAGNATCYVNPPSTPSDADLAWSFQQCSELVIPAGTDNTTMFQPSPFNLQNYIQMCKQAFGAPPRPNWITTYYGGHDIKLVLERFGSNIIFSNGLRDPFSAGGVLQNISDSLVAVYTVLGAHCVDILPARPSDPDWLIMQRKTEVEILKGWIAKYYADLRAYKN